MNRPQLNKRMQPINSIPNKEEYVNGVEFDGKFEVQAGRINASRVNIKRLFEASLPAEVSTTINNNETLSITSTLFFRKPKEADIILGEPYWAVYSGTAVVGSLQIFPRVGAGVATGDWACWSSFNWGQFDGVKSYSSIAIGNLTGSAGTVLIKVQWKYVLYNSTGV